MDYKKKYEEALERVRIAYKDEDRHLKATLERIFPELKESDDEKIRKELIAVINDLVLPDEQRTRFLSWLEKQGERESDIRYKYLDELLAADDIYQMSMNVAMTNEAKIKAVSALSKMCISELLMLEQQGNPTEINPSEFDLRLNRLLKQFETLPKEELVNSLSFYLNVVQNDGTYKEQGNYEFNGKITSRKSKGTLKTLIDEVEPKELSQSQVTKISDIDDDLDALGQAIFALEDLVDDSKPNTCYAGYHLPFKEAIKKLKSIKERLSL